VSKIKNLSFNAFSVIIIAFLKILELYTLSSNLTPTERGLFSLLTFYVLLSILLSEMGIQNSVYSQSNINDLQLRTLFWFNLLKSIFFYLVITFFLFLFCWFSGIEEFYTFAIAGVIVLLNGLGKFYRSVLISKGQIQQLSIIELISTLLEFIVIYFTISNLGIKSFVFGITLKFLIDNFFFFLKLNKTIQIFGPVSFKEIYKFIAVGIYDLLSQFVNFFSKEIDTILVTSFYGLEVLGVFNVSKQLTLKPIRLIGPIINNAFFPIFDKTKNNPFNFKESLNIQLSLNSTIISLIFLFIMAVKGLLISKFFPEKNNLNINFIFICFLLFSLIKGYWSPLGSLILTLGDTKKAFKFNVFVFVFSFLISIGFAYSFSVKWFAMSLFITVLISFVFSYFIFYSKYFTIQSYFKLTILNAWPLLIVVVLDKYDLNFGSIIMYSVFICMLYFLTQFNTIKNAFSYFKNI
jgi:O-antigen/teichoic acid export membrane protein